MSVRILHGDCRDVLPTLPAEAFDAVITSPPYWGLRSYLPESHADKALEIGCEPTLDAYVETMRAVARELWRVLKTTGCFWLNLGDCYAGSWSGNSMRPNGGTQRAGVPGFQPLDSRVAARSGNVPSGLKPKDLCMVPHRVALALQADGWWVRSAVVWHKPNPMPESVTDRPTSAYEMVFMLTKAASYFYDAEAISETCSGASGAEGRRVVRVATPKNKLMGLKPTREYDHELSGGRNARNVWTIATQSFKGLHFATMPPDLAERCIKAGCPAGGHVLDPFGGSGTTGLVADRLGRDATLIELNPAYRSMGADRISNDAPLLTEVSC